MKRIVVFAIVLVVGCAASSVISYRVGAARAKNLERDRVFWNTFIAADYLRKGDIKRGTRKVEDMCFVAGNTVYSDPEYRDSLFTRFFTRDVIKYRAAYCTNRAEWTEAEQKLQVLLDDWTRTHAVKPSTSN